MLLPPKYISNNTSQKLMCPIQFQSLLILFSLPNNMPYSNSNKEPKPFKSFWKGNTSLWQMQFKHILISQICFTCKPNSTKITHLQFHCTHSFHCTMNAKYLISILNLIIVQQDVTYSVYYISVASTTSSGCWHTSSGARTTVITASGID